MAYHIRVLAGKVDRLAGSHVYHQEMVRRLAARGHRVSLVCFKTVPEVAACAEVYEVPPQARPPGRFLWRFASLLQYRHCSRALRRLALPPADVVLGGEHLFLRAHADLFPRTPWIYHPHSLLVDQEIRSYNYPPLMNWVSTRVYVWLQRWALRHADRTMRFTRMACDALTTRYGGIGRFAVNPPGVDLSSGPSPRPEGGPVRLLWVGQLIPRKRIDLALACLGRVREGDWRFDIVGDGVARAELERQARELQLTNRVHFHGFQPRPADWYAQADLLLFPSWLENFPMTILEAMSHGVPCLALRGDGVRYFNANAEIIRPGENGFLADSDEDFGAQLERLVRDPGLLHAAKSAAHATAAQCFSWQGHLERFEAICCEVIAERGAGRPPLASAFLPGQARSPEARG